MKIIREEGISHNKVAVADVRLRVRVGDELSIEVDEFGEVRDNPMVTIVDIKHPQDNMDELIAYNYFYSTHDSSFQAYSRQDEVSEKVAELLEVPWVMFIYDEEYHPVYRFLPLNMFLSLSTGFDIL